MCARVFVYCTLQKVTIWRFFFFLPPPFSLTNFPLLNLWWDYPGQPRVWSVPHLITSATAPDLRRPSIPGWAGEGEHRRRGRLIRRSPNPAPVVKDYGRGTGVAEMYTHHNSPQGKVRLSGGYYLLLLCPLFIFRSHLIWRRNELAWINRRGWKYCRGYTSAVGTVNIKKENNI